MKVDMAQLSDRNDWLLPRVSGVFIGRTRSPPWRSAARQLVDTAALASLSESPNSNPLWGR